MVDPRDTRLDIQTDIDITQEVEPSYDGKIYLTISQWPGEPNTKKIDIKVDWPSP